MSFARSPQLLRPKPLAGTRKLQLKRPKRLPGHVLLELRVKRRSSLPPIRAHLLFGPDVNVAGRNQLFRPLDLDQHYSFDRIPGAFLSEDPLRRLAKDFEATVDSARAFLYAASVMLLVRRLARAS